MSTKNSDRNSETSNFEADRSAYTDKKYNLIPLSPKLIEHVRRLDSLNVSIIPHINNSLQETHLQNGNSLPISYYVFQFS